MGQRINYFKNNFHIGLKEIIFENFTSFRKWYLDTDKSSIEEFDEPFGNENLKNYLKQNTDFKTDFKHLDKNLIDELTSDFIGSYYDSTYPNNDLLEFFGPTMNVSRYTESDEMVLETKNKEFIKIWRYLTKGRSLKDNQEFESISNEYKIGFLTIKEVELLKNNILNYFGNIETMKSRYWTTNEKRELEKSKNGPYSLSGHNPKSSGLEYVLTAINELKEYNKELITGIE